MYIIVTYYSNYNNWVITTVGTNPESTPIPDPYRLSVLSWVTTL